MKKLLIGLSVVCTMLMSCVSKQANYEPKTFQLTQKDSSKTLEVNVGDQINIVLPDPNTTEDWIFIGTKRKEFLDMTRNESIDGQQYITFNVVGTGNVLLVFKYRYEKEVFVLRDFPTYVLTVKTEGIDK